MGTITEPSTEATSGWRMAESGSGEARRLENRGRAWIVLGFILCPCHLPVSMALLGGVVGGGVLGAAVRDAWILGVVMGTLYLFAVWRAFHHLRRAKAALAPGERLECSPSGECAVEPAQG